jgi:hypothetical protein
MVPPGMGLLDVPKGLISRLPVVGGLVDSKPADEAPEDEPDFDEPDEVEDEPEDEPDVEDDGEPDDDEAEDEPDDEPEASADEPDDEPEPEEPEDESDDQPDSDPGGPGGEAEEPTGSGSVDISDTTAPSIGPNTVIEKDTPEERLARHEQSDKDAMGLDKRRQVIGGNYSASFGKQLLRWAIVVVIVIGAAFGAKLLVDDIDQPPAHAADRAPWTGSQEAPKPLE